jgi:DNA-binding MarR family transcriptional regulator
LLSSLEREIRKLNAQSALFSQAVAEQVGINSSDFECLDIIILRGTATAGELASASGLATGAITGAIDRLERAGFARRAHDTADRRRVLVRRSPTSSAGLRRSTHLCTARLGPAVALQR